VDHVVKPDLVAPGNGVVSLLASTECTLAARFPDTLVSNSTFLDGASGNSHDYFKLSGTSMATPVVSGAVALMLQQNSKLTPDQVKARLMKTASKSFARYSVASDMLGSVSYSSQSDIFTVGAGYLDIESALSNTDLANFQALSPVAVYDPATKKVSLVSAQAVVWGDAVVASGDGGWQLTGIEKHVLDAGDSDLFVVPARMPGHDGAAGKPTTDRQAQSPDASRGPSPDSDAGAAAPRGPCRVHFEYAKKIFALHATFRHDALL